MTFSVLFWNIWLDNQLGGAEHSEKFLAELDRLVQYYAPDFIGLNELLQKSDAETPFILDYLKNKHGYEYNHFAAASPFTLAGSDWLIGTGFCSRRKPSHVKELTISRDTPAERRGHSGYEVKAIIAKIPFGEQEVSIITAHPLHLRLYTLKDHYKGTKVLSDLIHTEEFSKHTLLGGDFNEPDFMPRSLRNAVKDSMHMRTGSPWNTTWRHKAQPKAAIRANLDRLYWSREANFSLDSFKVIETNTSDHRPLFATFRCDTIQ